ncbi:MAG TPA: hypothetical protein VGK21_07340 [Candidatus Angelobacter sp.]|jgi:hypothetical protein
MAEQKGEQLIVVHLDIRKLKPEPETNLPPLSKAKLKDMVEEAIVDAYTEQEQTTGFLTMIQEHLTIPSLRISSVSMLLRRKLT